MSANIPSSGTVRQLDRRAEPAEQFTEEHAKDPARIARAFMTLLREVATLTRRWWPKRLDFEDVEVDATGTTLYRFEHGLGGQVRWWPVDWSDASAGASLERHADTDSNTLVLVSYVAGTVTVRIEEAGA